MSQSCRSRLNAVLAVLLNLKVVATPVSGSREMKELIDVKLNAKGWSVLTVAVLAIGAGLISGVGATNTTAKTNTPVILQQTAPAQPGQVEEPAGAPDNDAVEQDDQGGPDNETAEGPETGAQDGDQNGTDTPDAPGTPDAPDAPPAGK